MCAADYEDFDRFLDITVDLSEINIYNSIYPPKGGSYLNRYL